MPRVGNASAIRHSDNRSAVLRPLLKTRRPLKGLATRGASCARRRLGVSQPLIVELEQSEVSGAVTLHTLRRITPL
jgi:hypothetical protein